MLERAPGILLAVAVLASLSEADLLIVYKSPAPACATDPGAILYDYTNGRNIQKAIDDASDGDDILICGGTYGERLDLHGKALTLRGEADPNILPPPSNITTLSGEGLPGNGLLFTRYNQAGTVVSLQKILFYKGASTGGVYGGGAVTVENPGFTGCLLNIESSLFEGNTATSGGGAVENRGGDLNIEATAFKLNTSTSADAKGGAIYKVGSGNVTISSSSFFENSSSSIGGALSMQTGNLTIIESIFENNTSVSTGGALHLLQVHLQMSGSQMVANVSNQVGGAIYSVGEAAVINTTNFTMNRSVSGGGALYAQDAALTVSGGNFSANAAHIGGAILTSWGTMAVSGSNFYFNEALGAEGGAILSNSSTLAIDECEFFMNLAAGHGGALTINGSITNIQSSRFYSNQSTNLGGAILGGSTGEISDCHFEGNESSENGAAIHVYGLQVNRTVFRGNRLLRTTPGDPGFPPSVINGVGTLKNSLVRGNYSGTGATVTAQNTINTTVYNNLPLPASGPIAQVAKGTIRNSIIWHDDAFNGTVTSIGLPAQTTAQNAIIKGGFAGGTAIYDVNPKVVKSLPLDAYNLDFSLQKTSPAANRGNVAGIDPGPLDLAGNARIFEGTIDLGAYELTETVNITLTGNHTGQGFITPSDNGEPVNIPAGSEATLSFFPAEGNELAKVILNKGPGETVLLPADLTPIASGSYRHVIPGLAADLTVDAEFTRKNHTIVTTITNTLPAGSVLPGLTVSVPHGNPQTLYFRPAGKYKVGTVIVDKDTDNQRIINSGQKSLPFEGVVRDHTVEVEFVQCEFTNDVNPSYVKSTSYAQPDLSLISYVIPDGFGRVIQSQAHLNDGQRTNIVNGHYFDGLGREYITPAGIPYVPETLDGNGQPKEFQYINMGCEELVDRANAHWAAGNTDDRGVPVPDAKDFAFTEKVFRPEPSQTVYEAGALGDRTSLPSGRTAKSWSFGVPGSDDFLTGADLDPVALDTRFAAEQLDGYSAQNEYVLMVSKDADGKYSQAIKDKFGATIATKKYGNRSLEASASLSILEKDLRNHVTETILPDGQQTKQSEANGLGQVVRTSEPDKGEVQNRYDALGRLRFSKNEKHKAMDDLEPTIEHFTINTYDALGRLVSVGVNESPTADFDSPDVAITGTIKTEHLYDEIGPSKLAALIPDAAERAAMAPDLVNLYGQLAGVVNYQDGGGIVGDIYAYHVNGLRKAIYMVRPGLPTQKIEFAYNDGGFEVRQDYFSGYVGSSWVLKSRKLTERDELGRLHVIKEGPLADPGSQAKVVQYELNHMGVMHSKQYFATGSALPLETVTHTSDITGLREISSSGSTPLFKEKLAYSEDGLGEKRFTGLLQGVTYEYQESDGSTQIEAYQYSYDDMGRIVRVRKELPAETPPQTIEDFTEYSFDVMGRFTLKKETEELAYSYWPGTNRVKNIGVSGDKFHEHGNYVYDPTGNLVLDRSKSMTVDYDWSGRAVSFNFYETMPSTDLDWYGVADNKLETLNGRKRVAQIAMAYTAGGDRVLKKAWRHIDGAGTKSWDVTAYVGELAVFENTSVSDPNSLELQYVNYLTPGGVAGRRHADGRQFFYLKDHLGSVYSVLEAPDPDLQELKTYLPYGTPSSKFLKGGKPTRLGFASKEFDSEGYDLEKNMRLAYHGSRYFDPELGLWFAPDPASQFFNSYGFGGDPVNFVDPNGEFIIPAIIIGAAIGAYIGGVRATGSYSLDGFDITQDWDEVLKGAVVGAATGAVAGALGTGAAILATKVIGGGSVAAGTAMVSSSVGLTLGVGAVAGAVGGAAAGAASYGLNAWAFGDDFSGSGLGRAIGMGAATGAVGGFLGSGMVPQGELSGLNQYVGDFVQGAVAGLGVAATTDLFDDGRFNAGPGRYFQSGLAGGAGGIAGGMARRMNYARNNNQPNTKAEVDKFALDNNMELKIYPKKMSEFHEPYEKYALVPRGAPGPSFNNIPPIEVVIDPISQNVINIDIDPITMGTFNHGQNAVTHWDLDVAPYTFWGNRWDYRLY